MRIEQVSDGTLSRRALYSGRPTTTSWINYPNFSGVDFRWNELPCSVRSIPPMWPCSLFPLVSFPPALLGLRYSSSRLIGAWTSRRFASWWVVSYFFCIPTLPPFTGGRDYQTKHIAIAIRLSLLVVLVGFVSCPVRGRTYCDCNSDLLRHIWFCVDSKKTHWAQFGSFSIWVVPVYLGSYLSRWHIANSIQDALVFWFSLALWERFTLSVWLLVFVLPYLPPFSDDKKNTLHLRAAIVSVKNHFGAFFLVCGCGKWS